MKFRGNTFDSVWGISSINISALHHDNKHTLITNYTPRTITKCTCNKNKKITCSHNSNLATAITDNKMSVDSWHVPVVCLGHRVLVKTDRPSTTVFTDPLGIGPLHRIICNPYSTWGGGGHGNQILQFKIAVFRYWSLIHYICTTCSNCSNRHFVLLN